VASHEGTQDLRRKVPQQLLDSRGRAQISVPLRPRTGRTSTSTKAASGTRAAISSARAMLSHSTRKKPARCSFTSANGPAPPAAATTIALVRTREGNHSGIDTQLRFTTEDARADHVALRAQGVDADAEVMSYPVPMFSFRDPAGNRLVIVERPTAR
jgi:hypothetical protein